MAICKRCGEKPAYLCLPCQGDLEESLTAEVDRNVATLRREVDRLKSQVDSTEGKLSYCISKNATLRARNAELRRALDELASVANDAFYASSRLRSIPDRELQEWFDRNGAAIATAVIKARALLRGEEETG